MMRQESSMQQTETTKQLRKRAASAKKPAGRTEASAKSTMRTRKQAHPAASAVLADSAVPITDTGFTIAAHDETLAELRHRLISDAAYARYVGRGYADGYDVEDWLEAEAEVDRALTAAAEAPIEPGP
jgi:hypothetical protein